MGGIRLFLWIRYLVSRDLNTKFTPWNWLFGHVKWTKSADLDKYGYSGFGIRFDARSQFSFNSELGKNVAFFGGDSSLLLHTDNRKENIVVLGGRPANGLDDTIITAEAKYSVDIPKLRRKTC